MSSWLRVLGLNRQGKAGDMVILCSCGEGKASNTACKHFAEVQCSEHYPHRPLALPISWSGCGAAKAPDPERDERRETVVPPLLYLGSYCIGVGITAFS